MTGFSVKFFVSKTLAMEVATYTVQEGPGTLAFLDRVIGSKICADIIICCQTIIEAFPKITGPHGFNGPTTDQMTSKQASDCSMTGGGHIVHVQSRFGSMEGGIIGTRYRIFVIAFSCQDLGCA